VTERIEMLSMSDGTRLYTRILLPSTQGRFPIVFQRTPYGETHRSWQSENCLPYLRRGYALVQQHVRGSGRSEGAMMRTYCERQDGLDTLALLRSMPFYNGEIYLAGESYGATAHLCYLATRPPDVKAAALGIQQDHMYTYRYRNGCCRDWCSLRWNLARLQRPYPHQRPWQDVLQRPFKKIMERAVGEDIPAFTAMLLNDTYNDYWQSQENDRVAEHLQIPLLLTDGWFDLYVPGMFHMWQRLPQETRCRSAFAVGPWGHSTRLTECDYPLEDPNLPDDLVPAFFDHVRLGSESPLPLGMVTWHNITGGQWKSGLPPTQEQRLYFSADGTLTNSPGPQGEQSYRYDPELPLNFYRHNSFSRRPTKTPEGVLTFLSESAQADAEVCGPIRWHMTVKTDCADTAFFLRLYIEEADGTAWNLTDTITSLTHQKPDYAAGDLCSIAVETPPIGFLWKKGCRLRADISSHSDLYVPHANVRGHWAQVTQTRTARNTVLLDEGACICLPVRKESAAHS